MIKIQTKSRLLMSLGAATAGLVACAPTHVGFVTSTSIGIGADASTGKASVAYSRDELFVGPSYPDGGIPPVLGTQTSTGRIIENVQHQALATGDAAIILGNDGTGPIGILAKQIKQQEDLCKGISDPKNKETCDKSIDSMRLTQANIAATLAYRQQCSLNAGCGGEYNPPETSIFGTQTDWGLTIQADPSTFVMSKVNLGFQRKEATLAKIGDKKSYQSFPSMLALFGSDYDVTVDKSCWAPPKPAPQAAAGGTPPPAPPADAPKTDATTPPKADDPPKPSTDCVGASTEGPFKRYAFGVAQVIATGAAADGIATDRWVSGAILSQIQGTAAKTDESGRTAEDLKKERAKTPAQQAGDKTEEAKAEEAKRVAQLKTDITNARTAAAASPEDAGDEEIANILAVYGLTKDQAGKFSDNDATKKAYGDISAIIKDYNEAIANTPRDGQDPKQQDPKETLGADAKISDFEDRLSKNSVLRKFFSARTTKQSA